MSNTYTSIELNTRIIFEGDVAKEFRMKFDEMITEIELMNFKGNKIKGETSDTVINEISTFTDNEVDGKTYYKKGGQDVEDEEDE